MKVKTLVPFDDLEGGFMRHVGDTFECSQARYKALISSEYGVLVESVESPKKANTAATEGKTAATTKSTNTRKKAVK